MAPKVTLIMFGFSFGVCTLVLDAPSAIAQSTAAVDGVAPMLTITGQPSQFDRETFVIDRTAEARCGGQAVAPLRREDLSPRVFSDLPLLPGQPPRPEPGPIADEAFAFTIDAEGRPISIGKSTRTDGVVVISTEPDWEVQASLVAWRFTERSRSDCQLVVSSHRRSVEDTPVPVLARALALGRQSVLNPVLRDAMSREDDDCAGRHPRIRTASTADRRRGATPPGGRDWVAVRFDVDAAGVARNVERLASSGDPGWDEEALRSVSETTFLPSARTGCVVGIQSIGDDQAAPFVAPDAREFSRCSSEQRARLATGRLTYPEAFSRRGIEGWALVRFSLASWGAVNDIEVIEAQPAAAFGDAATRLVRSSSVAAGPDHAIGCVDRVIFRMPEDGERSNVD